MGDNMKHSEMHKKNLLSVFCAVLDGDNTLQRLIENLSIGHTTIEKACTTLVDRRILSAYKEMKGISGRPEYNFSLCSSHYCVYIEENEQYFSCILIDANQYAIDRFDKQKFVYSVSLEEVIKRISDTLRERDDFETFCRGIFIDCSDESAKYLPSNFTRIKKYDFIANALKNDDEISIFEFPDECIINVYGNIIKTEAKTKGILRVFPNAQVYVIKKPFYEEIFASLQKITIKEIKNLI
jgi:hypothetical protein